METAVVGQDIDARANLADRRGRTRHMGPSMAVPMAELVWWALNPNPQFDTRDLNPETLNSSP